MAKSYVVELEGTITLNAADEIEAEDKAMDFIHGDMSTVAELGTNVDVEFNVVNSTEVEV